MTYTALLDANVLYPAVTRDILMRLAVTDIYKARRSNDIHREWIENLLENEPKRERAKLERTRELMDLNVRDALVTGYEPLISGIVGLPDPGDRHVLAAVIVGRCDVIVTRTCEISRRQRSHLMGSRRSTPMSSWAPISVLPRVSSVAA